MKRILLKSVKAITSLIVIISVGIVFLVALGKLTDESPLSGYELKSMPELPDEQNAYQLLSFVDQAGYDVNPLAKEVDHVLYHQWSESRAQKLLGESAEILGVLRDAIKMAGFETSLERYDSPFTNYSALLAFSKLTIVQSRLAAEQGRLDDAVRFWNEGLEFSKLIKSDNSSILIAIAIGQVMLEHQLSWAHRLMTDYDMPLEQIIAIEEGLSKLRDRSNSEFELVFTGEFNYSELILDFLHQAPIKERINTLEFSDVRALLPEYFVQRQSLSNSSQKRFFELQRQTEFLCLRKMNFELVDAKPNRQGWLAWLAPNSLGRDMFSMEGSEVFKKYAKRHCLVRFHVEALRAVAGIKRWQMNGAERTTLDSSWLAVYSVDQIPRDPFSNEPLGVDFSNQLIYSVGSDFRKNGLSEFIPYYLRCSDESNCAENPVLQIYAPAPVESLKQYETHGADDECEDDIKR